MPVISDMLVSHYKFPKFCKENYMQHSIHSTAIAIPLHRHWSCGVEFDIT